MAKRIDVKNVNIYYGKFLAVSECSLTLAAKRDVDGRHLGTKDERP